MSEQPAIRVGDKIRFSDMPREWRQSLKVPLKGDIELTVVAVA